MECKYCKSVLKTEASLKAHQKRARYCLKLQGKEEKKEMFSCEFCKKEFTFKKNMKRHMEICPANSNNIQLIQQENKLLKGALETLKKEHQHEIDILKQKVEMLEKIEKDYKELTKTLAEKPTYTTNTTTNNTTKNTYNLAIFNKSAEDIEALAEAHYDCKHLLDGQKGAARFTQQFILNRENKEDDPIYLITDKNRGNAKYKNSNNEFVTDVGMYGLSRKVLPGITKKGVKLINTCEKGDEYICDLTTGLQNIKGMRTNNADFRKEIVRANC